MVQIPVWEKNVSSLPGASKTPLATDEAFGAGIGKAQQQLGQTIAKTTTSIGDSLAAEAEKNDRFTATAELSAWETQQALRLQQLERDTPPDQITNLPAQYAAENQATMAGALERIPQSQRQRATLHMQQFSNRQGVRLSGVAQQKSDEFYSSRVDQNVAAIAGALKQNPDDLEGSRLRLEAVINDAPLPDWQKRMLYQRNLSSLVSASLQGYEEQISPPDGKPGLTGPERAGALEKQRLVYENWKNWSTKFEATPLKFDKRSDVQPTGRSQYALSFFQSKGMAPEDAAAIVWNLQQESGKQLNPTLSHDGGTGFGIAGFRDPKPGSGRWTNLKRFAAAHGSDASDFHTQLEFVWNELNGPERAAFAAAQSAKSVGDKARAFIGYFRPYGPYARDRASRADQAGGLVVPGGKPVKVASLGQPTMSDATAGAPPAPAAPTQTAQADVPGNAKSGLNQTEMQRMDDSLQTILTRTRNAANLSKEKEVAAVDREIKNDSLRILETGKESELSRDRVERAFGPQYADTWESNRQADREFYAVTGTWKNGSGGDRAEGLKKLDPANSPDAPNYVYRKALYDKAVELDNAYRGRDATVQNERYDRQIIDAKAGIAPLPDRATIERDPLINEDKRNSLLKSHDAAAGDIRVFQETVGNFKDGIPINPFDKPARDAADRLYRSMGETPASLQAVVDRLGTIPDSAVLKFRGALASNNPEAAQAALSAMSNILTRNPRAFAGVTDGNQLEDAAIAFRHYVDERGMTGAAAAQKWMVEQTSEYKASVNAKVKGEDIAKLLKDKVAIGDLAGEFDPSFFGLARNPEVEFDADTRRAAFSTYQELVKEKYLATANGDLSLAKKQAAAEMKTVWGVSQLNGRKVLMRYPPEANPGFAGVENASDLVAAQVIAAIKDETKQDVDRGSLRIAPIPGVTATRVKRGMPGQYIVSWEDKNGNIQTLNPGRAFEPDFSAARNALQARREKDFKRQQTDLENIGRKYESQSPEQPFTQPNIKLAPKAPQPSPAPAAAPTLTPKEPDPPELLTRDGRLKSSFTVPQGGE